MSELVLPTSKYPLVEIIMTMENLRRNDEINPETFDVALRATAENLKKIYGIARMSTFAGSANHVMEEHALPYAFNYRGSDESIGCKAGLCITERFSNVRAHPDEVKKNLLILIDEFAENPPTSKTYADHFRRIFSLMYDWIYTPLYSRSVRAVDDEMYTIEEINMAIYHHKMGCIIYPQDGGIFTIKKIHLD